MMMDNQASEAKGRLPGVGREVYSAGVLALTEPGPAAAGVVVADSEGRMLASRSQYLGSATRSEASAQALLASMRLAIDHGLEAPNFRAEDRQLIEALASGETLPDRAGLLLPDLREAAAALPGHRLELVSPGSNPARSVALTPLVDWLPERTRRSEGLRVRPIGDHIYEVESESQPGQVYHINLGATGPSGPAPVECECADFTFRGIPCKHLLAVAREAGVLERLFYPEHAKAAAPVDPDSV